MDGGEEGEATASIPPASGRLVFRIFCPNPHPPTSSWLRGYSAPTRQGSRRFSLGPADQAPWPPVRPRSSCAWDLPGGCCSYALAPSVCISPGTGPGGLSHPKGLGCPGRHLLALHSLLSFPHLAQSLWVASAHPAASGERRSVARPLHGRGQMRSADRQPGQRQALRRGPRRASLSDARDLAFPGPVWFLARKQGLSWTPGLGITSAGTATAQGLGLSALVEGAAPGPSLV